MLVAESHYEKRARLSSGGPPGGVAAAGGGGGGIFRVTGIGSMN